MPAIKVLVAEDDPLHASRIEMLLEEMGYEVIGPFAAETDILRMFRATHPDLVVLDIQLKGGGDGIDIASRIRDIKATPTIFVTSFEDTETIKRALEADPYAYIVKPVEKGSLQASIELAIHKFSQEKNQEKNTGAERNPFQGWANDVLIQDSFFVKAGDKLVKLPLDEILWIEVAEERYCDILTLGRRYHLRTSLSSLEQKLDPSYFFRIHRTCIVNLRKIESINEADMTISIDGQEVPLGKAFKTDLLKRLKKLL